MNMTTEKLELDNSSRSQYHSCPRKFYLSDIKLVRYAKGSTALRYGSTWHVVLNAFNYYIMREGWSSIEDAKHYAIEQGAMSWRLITDEEGVYWEQDYRTFESLVEAFLEYLTHYDYDNRTMKILATEESFEHHIPIEFEEGHYPFLIGRDVIFIGKIDLRVEMQGVPWIVDYKTTGQPLSMQKNRLHRSGQMLGYVFYSVSSKDFPTYNALVDIHELSARKKKDGDYGNIKIDFNRSPYIFTPGDVASWRESFLYTANQIAQSIDTDQWPQQFDSCYTYGRCQYANLCEQNKPFNQLHLDGYYIAKERWSPVHSVF